MTQDQHEIILAKPIVLGNLTWEKLTLREPTAGDLEKTDGHGPIGGNIQIIAAVSGVPVAGIRQLCQGDLEAAAAVLRNFTAASRRTGAI